MRGTAIAIGVALAVLSVPAAAGAAVPIPDSDPFYQPPVPIPSVSAGTVLRSRPTTVTAVGIPLGVSAWQILYRTSDTKNTAEAAVATVLLPNGSAPPGGRPLLAYQPAEDALTTRCAPSYELRTGAETETPTIMLALAQGWAVVVPDFEGPRSQWSAGVQEGHATLDAIRAAEGFPPLGLHGNATQVGVWGYSGGGHASAWAAELAPDYAPELNIKGVAYGGVAADIGLTLRKLDGGALAGILLGGTVGVSRAYPELKFDSLLNASGRAMVADIGRGCLSDWILPYAFHHIRDYTTAPDPLSLPQAKRVIAADSLGQHEPAGPQYVYWATGDELNPLAEGDALVARYCSEGVSVEYHRQIGEHITLAATGAAGVLQYLTDRFAGIPAPSSCAPAPAPPQSLRRFATLQLLGRQLRLDRGGHVLVRVRNPNTFTITLTSVALRGRSSRIALARAVVRAQIPTRGKRAVRLRVKRSRLQGARRARVLVELAASAPGGLNKASRLPTVLVAS